MQEEDITEEQLRKKLKSISEVFRRNKKLMFLFIGKDTGDCIHFSKGFTRVEMLGFLEIYKQRLLKKVLEEENDSINF